MAKKLKSHASRRKRELTETRNLLRGAKNPALALSAIRNSIPTGQYNEIIEWIRLNPVLRSKLFPAPFPRELAPLESAPLLGSLSPPREIRWAVAYLLRYLDEIDRFVSRANEFAHAFLTSDFHRCSQALNAVESEFGYSIWLIKNRILLSQTAHGLEAQKTYSLDVIGNSVSKGVVAFITHFISLRNEVTVTPHRFLEIFNRSLRKAALAADLEASLRYHILPDFRLNSGQIAGTLRYEYCRTVIDYYECFIRACQSAVVNDCSEVWADLQPSLRTLRARIKDNRIDMLLLELDKAEPGDSLYCENSMEAIDSFLEGRYAVAREKALSLLEDNSLRFDLWEIVARVNGILRTKVGSRDLRGKTLDRMSSLLTKSETLYEDVIELLRFALNFSTNSWANSLLGFIKSEISSNPLEAGGGTVHQAALSTNLINPLRAVGFPSTETQHTYIGFSQASYGSRTVVKAGLVAINKDSQGTDLTALAVEQRLLLDTYIATASHKYDVALEAARKLAESEIHYYRRKSARTISDSLLKLGRIEECIEFVAASLITNPQLHFVLPLEPLVDSLDKGVRRRMESQVALPIFYDMYSRFLGHNCDSLRNYAYEDFLVANGMRRPSELELGSVVSRFDHSSIVYFLRYVCIESVMDVSTEFDGSVDVARERLEVCRLLSELDGENIDVYQNEIKDINRRLMIQQRIREVEQSKIYVDVDSIKKKLERTIKESFNRYQSFLKHGLDLDSFIYRRLSMQLLSRGIESALKLALPQNEMTELFESIIIDLRDEYVSSNEHGLDGYLSVRIRHGTLYGQLRSPLESEHLITQRDHSTGTYKRNEYWLSRFGSTNKNLLNTINTALAKFSAQFDELVSVIITEWIQIKKASEDKGLFDFVFTRPEVHILSNLVSAETTFDEFVDSVFGGFGERLQVDLGLIRERLATEAKTQFVDMLNNLQAAVSDLGYVLDLGDFNRAISNARTRMPIVINRISEWFSIAKTTAKEPFLIEDAVRISEASVRTFHQTFTAEVTVLNDKKVPFGAQFLSGFVDIFFILFENIVRHSGVDINPKASVTIIYEQLAVRLQVANAISHGVANQAAKDRIESIKSTMKQESYLESVKSEGGTGFYKVRKIMVHDFGVPPRIDFGFSDDAAFFVEITLPFLEVEKG